MVKSSGKTFVVDIFRSDTPDAGIFTWDIKNNTVYSDSALADLFGLDAYEAEHGLPIETFLDRVHPEDRPGLAKIIRDAIIAELPHQAVYRVMDQRGHYSSVASFGRCFRDRSGEPTLYSGIVVPAHLTSGAGNEKPH